MTGIFSLPSKHNRSLAPLAVFRIIFGALLLFSTIRFWLKGWIYELYIQPQFHFKYFGFDWIKVAPGWLMYTLFVLMALAALGILLGYRYRLSATLFFLTFTYVELIDVANYLNHYYFVSLMSLLLIFLPAHRLASLDVYLKRVPLKTHSNHWAVSLLKLQLAIVYVYAGIAKLNPDWLLEALPLKIWLPAQAHLPLIGPLLKYTWVAYFFSWFGAFYDLTVPFFLSIKKTRPYAFAAVILFHLLTWWLFPIGVFPWVMIFSTLIFFSDNFHQKILARLPKVFKVSPLSWDVKMTPTKLPLIAKTLIAGYLAFQLLFPFRFLLYSQPLFWTEQGYRFSWRVMLVEKAGYVTYTLTNPSTGFSAEIEPSEYLNPNQEKQLSTQADLILQFAHFLEKEYQKKGVVNPVITAQAYVSLQSQPSRLFINPTVDLTNETESFAAKKWILPYAH